MASFIFDNAKALIGRGSLPWESGTFKVMLIGTTVPYTPSQSDVFIAALAASELSTTGYVGGFAGSGRKTLANKAVTIDAANHKAFFDADDVTWTAIGTAAGVTVAAFVIVKEVTSDADSLLVAYIDPTDQVLNGGNMTRIWDATGGLFRF